MAERAEQQYPMIFESHEARLQWERERLAEADADIAAGRVISGQEAIDWLDRWAAGEELEEPTFD
ncbi:antitoxin [Brevundimonas staleyi]|uniref:Antitoxin n=1 Tax=Brevundimonas staleyi TaxID=74326 RepID=A0ABW0FWR4_9CAUL